MMKLLKALVPLVCLFAIVLTLFACSQNSPEALFNRGQRAFEEGDYLGASIYFEEFTNKYPEEENALIAYIRLAQSFMMIQDYASARSVLEEMKENSSDPEVDISSDFQIAQTYFEEGSYDQAVQTFNNILSATDNPYIEARVYTGLGNIYARETQMATAEQMYDQLYQVGENEIDDPTTALEIKLQALSSKAKIFQASGFFDRARDMHMKVLDVVNNATGIAGIERDKQNAILNWAHTWAWAGDYISAATIYDQLHTNPYITEEVKPQLIVWKVNSLERLFWEEGEEDYNPEEKAVLVHELQRLVDGYSKTDAAINARVQIAQLVKDSTPEMAQQYLSEAINMYEQYIAQPPNPQRPIVAMLQIADAYIRMEQYDQAKAAIERLMQTYGQVPEAVQQAQSMLNHIKKQEIQAQQEKAGSPASATGTVPSASPESPANSAEQ